MSQNKENIFEYNGYTFEYDLADADDSEKYENAIEIMGKEEKTIPKTGKLSEIYRAQCGMIKRFFDNCLEEGAGEKICGEKDNVSNCYNAYTVFLDFVASQRDRVLSVKNSLSKYSNRPIKKPTDHLKKKS